MTESGPVTGERLPDSFEPRARIPARPQRSGLARAVAISVVPVSAVALGLLAGGIVVVISSVVLSDRFDPTLALRAYSALFRGSLGSANGVVSTVVSAAPLILGGLAVGIGFKAGLFNIGAQGQFLIGAVSAAAAGASLAGAPGPVAIGGAMAAGALGGAAYGLVPGALKAWTGAHEVVTTIMLNFIAGSLIGFLITGPLGAPGFSFARTGPLGNAELPILFGRGGHLGVLVAVAFVPLAWWLLWRSTLGFEIRTVGANPNAARYAGMRPGYLIALTMSMCGMLAGLAGANQILGISHFMNASYGTNIGFDSISIALLGRAHPVGILLAALLFGALRAGSGLMQIDAGIPVEIIDVIQAVILLFLAADVLVRRVLRLRAPSAAPEELRTVTRSYGEQGAGTP
jgi:simple sugar transport system permease protein